MSLSTFMQDLMNSADYAASECRLDADSIKLHANHDNFGCESENTFCAIFYENLRKKLSRRDVLALEPGKQYHKADLVYCPAGLSYDNVDVKDKLEKVMIEVKVVGPLDNGKLSYNDNASVATGISQTKALVQFDPHAQVVFIVAFIGYDSTQLTPSDKMNLISHQVAWTLIKSIVC
jgi:hypothetical protein